MIGMISQPRYLPALNYLQRIYNSEIFIVLDDVQHQRRCFEHRNKIISNGDAKWLSISMDRSISSRPLIKDLFFKDDFLTEHNHQITIAYSKAKFYDNELYKKIYKTSGNYFVSFFVESLQNTFNFLGLKLPKIFFSSSANIVENGSKKIADICNFFSVDKYVSGPNGAVYLDKTHFEGIEFLFHNFDFPIYQQLSKKFIPWTCWLDAYFNMGTEFVKSVISSPMDLKNA